MKIHKIPGYHGKEVIETPSKTKYKIQLYGAELTLSRTYDEPAYSSSNNYLTFNVKDLRVVIDKLEEIHKELFNKVEVNE